MSLGCGTQGQEKLAAYLVVTSLSGCFSGAQVSPGWSLRPQKAQDERDPGLTAETLGLRPGSDQLLTSTHSPRTSLGDYRLYLLHLEMPPRVTCIRC